MTTLQIRAYRETDQDAVVALWRECGLVRPWNDPVKDIHRKARQPTCSWNARSGWSRPVMAGYESSRRINSDFLRRNRVT